LLLVQLKTAPTTQARKQIVAIADNPIVKGANNYATSQKQECSRCSFQLHTRKQGGADNSNPTRKNVVGAVFNCTHARNNAIEYK
jgi:hypothetical protein